LSARNACKRLSAEANARESIAAWYATRS